MSYILEALKKAQAERQLGNAPTIHAPAPAYAAPPTGAGGKGRHLAIALGLGAGAVLVAAVLLWQRQQGGEPVRLAATSAPAAKPAETTPAPVPAPASAPPSASPPAAPAAAPPPVAPATAQRDTPPPATRPAPQAPPAPAVEQPPAPAPTAPKAAQPAPAPAPPPASGDDSLPTLQQLPDALQRELPRVTFGGYIYSPTPGESLLLVDKALRREGEQVAPGLVLERLLPKAAVMNYRGTRYRVSY